MRYFQIYNKNHEGNAEKHWDVFIPLTLQDAIVVHLCTCLNIIFYAACVFLWIIGAKDGGVKKKVHILGKQPIELKEN